MERERERILAFLGRSIQSLADEVRSFPGGWAVRTHSLPLVWTLNQVRLCEPRPFEEAVALAEEHQAGLPYRHLVIEDPDGGETAARARSAGWATERELLMALHDGPDRDVDTSLVEVIDEAEMLALMARWSAEEHPEIADDALAQLSEYHRREGRLWDERRFGVRARDRAVAVTKLRLGDSVAWVEDVYTVPEARGRGHARRLVSHASGLARAASPEVCFIVADDEDWPKQLYAKLGFHPCGMTHTLHKTVDSNG